MQKKNKQRAGEKHYAWNGGIKNEMSVAWATQRIAAFRYKCKKYKYAAPDITPERLITMYQEQNSCAICGFVPAEGGYLSVDHDHETGEVRGLLCNGCNIAEGHVKSDYARALYMSAYLTPKGKTPTVKTLKHNGVVCYLSGPITKGDRVLNLRQANHAQKVLMSSGFAVINPMLTMVIEWAWDVPHNAWLDGDMSIVERCDCVLRLPGESKGADMEVAHAEKHNIPVFYDIDELSAAREYLWPAEAVT